MKRDGVISHYCTNDVTKRRTHAWFGGGNFDGLLQVGLFIFKSLSDYLKNGI